VPAHRSGSQWWRPYSQQVQQPWRPAQISCDLSKPLICTNDRKRPPCNSFTPRRQIAAKLGARTRQQPRWCREIPRRYWPRCAAGQVSRKHRARRRRDVNGYDSSQCGYSVEREGRVGSNLPSCLPAATRKQLRTRRRQVSEHCMLRPTKR
jgi:hypothetical protein